MSSASARCETETAPEPRRFDSTEYCVTRIPVGASARLYTAVTRLVSRRSLKQVQPRTAVPASGGAALGEAWEDLPAVIAASIVHMHVFASGVIFDGR